MLSVFRNSAALVGPFLCRVIQRGSTLLQTLIDSSKTFYVSHNYVKFMYFVIGPSIINLGVNKNMERERLNLRLEEKLTEISLLHYLACSTVHWTKKVEYLL